MTVDELLTRLEKEKTLYDIFCFISEYSTEYLDEYNFIKTEKVILKEIIELIKSDIIRKDYNIIKGYINDLVEYGLINYFDEKGEEVNEVDSIKSDILISLTEHIEPEVDGVQLYKAILSNKRSEKNSEDFGNAFEAATRDILKPYKEEIETLTKDLNDKMDKINSKMDNDMIKNIQVISVFAGIISLLFANVMGMKEFASIGATGLLLLNLSIVISVFTLLIFTRIIIIDNDINWGILILFLVILLFITFIIILTSQGIISEIF